MAKFTFILTLFMIALVTFTTISSSVPDNDVVDLDVSTKNTLLLPSENRETEETSTAGFAKALPETDEGKTAEVSDLPEEHPMEIIRFHPINRHFPANHLGSLRVPRHRCRHNSIGDKPIGRPHQMSFGDDMIVATGENGDFEPMVHGEVRQVPERWVRIHPQRHHHHHHEGMPMGKHHDFFANQRFREERDEMGGQEERHDGGFMRSVRKFLNGRF